MKSLIAVAGALAIRGSSTVHSAEPGSVCFGTTSDGRLQGGVRLPREGPNFTSYSTLAVLLGRTYVHSTVRGVVLSA